jgi:hypothetical protein
MNDIDVLMVILCCLGLVMGWWASKIFHLHLLRSILRDLGVTNRDLVNLLEKARAEEDPEEDPELEQIDIKVEKHSNTLYAFRKDNDQFLGQGQSREQLIEAMGLRLKNVRLIIVEGREHMESKTVDTTAV